MQSPHGEAAKPGGIRLCESCHGNHAILAADESMFETVCRKCHQPGSRGATTASQIHGLLVDAAGRQAEAVAAVQKVRAVAPIEEMQSRLDEAHTALQQLRTDQHILSPEKVEQETLIVRSAADEVLAAVQHEWQELATRRLGLLPFWGYVLITVGALYWKRRRIERREAGGSAAGTSRGGD